MAGLFFMRQNKKMEYKLNKQLLIILSIVGISLIAITAEAAPKLLIEAEGCGAGNAKKGIAIGDVTGNPPLGANDCWGTYNDNDPQKDGFKMVDMLFKSVAKLDMPSSVEGRDIGLIVKETTEGGQKSGTWSFNGNTFDPLAFLIVLKEASSKPGYTVWLFDDADETTAGNWEIAWSPDLSNRSIYEKVGAGPIPAPFWLFGSALLAIFGFTRRKSKSSFGT